MRLTCQIDQQHIVIIWINIIKLIIVRADDDDDHQHRHQFNGYLQFCFT